MKQRKHISCHELKTKMETHGNFILVDVLSAQDHQNAHIQGAIHIPLEELESKGSQWLNHQIDIIVYSANTACKGAQFAQEKLGQMGFRVWTLDGGLEAWEKVRYPMEDNPKYKAHITQAKPAALEPQSKEPPETEAPAIPAPIRGKGWPKEAQKKNQIKQPLPKKKAA